jgi:hypothetical protein
LSATDAWVVAGAAALAVSVGSLAAWICSPGSRARSWIASAGGLAVIAAETAWLAGATATIAFAATSAATVTFVVLVRVSLSRGGGS